MYGVEAFVLSATDIGEYDRMYSLLTREFGKVRAVARSVRKSAAKLAGHLDIPNKSWVELVPTSKGWQVTRALEQESFHAMRADRVALSAVLSGARFMDAFVHEMRDQELFGLWEHFLSCLSRATEQDNDRVALVTAQFKIRALFLFGFLPDLSVCSSCEQKFTDSHAQLFMHGIWCAACSARQHVHGLRVSAAALAEVRSAAQGTWSEMSVHIEDMRMIAGHFERQARQYMV